MTGVKGVMQANNMLANTVEVATKGRAAGATVMHAPITFAEGYGELTPTPMESSRALSITRRFARDRGARKSSTCSIRTPEDIIVEGKRGLDAFPQHQS